MSIITQQSLPQSINAQQSLPQPLNTHQSPPETISVAQLSAQRSQDHDLSASYGTIKKYEVDVFGQGPCSMVTFKDFQRHFKNVYEPLPKTNMNKIQMFEHLASRFIGFNHALAKTKIELKNAEDALQRANQAAKKHEQELERVKWDCDQIIKAKDQKISELQKWERERKSPADEAQKRNTEERRAKSLKTRQYPSPPSGLTAEERNTWKTNQAIQEQHATHRYAWMNTPAITSQPRTSRTNGPIDGAAPTNRKRATERPIDGAAPCKRKKTTVDEPINRPAKAPRKTKAAISRGKNDTKGVTQQELLDKHNIQADIQMEQQTVLTQHHEAVSTSPPVQLEDEEEDDGLLAAIDEENQKDYEDEKSNEANADEMDATSAAVIADYHRLMAEAEAKEKQAEMFEEGDGSDSESDEE